MSTWSPDGQPFPSLDDNRSKNPQPSRRMKDHYTTLGLGSSATLGDIKKSFRQKASQYHPDRNTDADAPARFRAVQEAYEVLSDDARRLAYDDNRRRNLLDNPAQTAREIWQAYFQPLIQTAR
jgi:DnaJ-class molecular chaperone